MSGKDNPRREFLRHTVRVPLEITSAGNGAAHVEEGVNIGYGGLAFVSSVCPTVGDVLHLRIETVDPPFEADARVAWCRSEGDGYLVGVEFLDAAAPCCRRKPGAPVRVTARRHGPAPELR